MKMAMGKSESKYKISAIVKCQLLAPDLLEMTKNAVRTIKPYVDELILIDHASVYGQGWMKNEADIYIRNKKSGGFPITVKQGMGVATGDYVAVLNNDILFSGDWVTPLVKLFENGVGLVHPKMLNWKDKIKSGNVVKTTKDPQGELFFSAFMLDPIIYKEIGGWDIDYDFWGYDDWDYYYRLSREGFKTIWTDRVSYRHKGGATISRIGREKFEKKNYDLFVEKHGVKPEDIKW